MTNEKIILNERFNLMQAGIIGTNGKYIKVPAADGTTRTIPAPAEIHTYNGWKARGYQVKKGEHCKAKFPVWVPMGKKADPEAAPDADGENIKMRLKTSYWFSPSQVQPIEAATDN